MYKRLLLFTSFWISCTCTISPRCRSKFHLDESTNTNSNYRKAWLESCSAALNYTCRKNLTISYFEMEPFTNGKGFNKQNLTGGLLQQILSIALAECCGSCLNITFNKVKGRRELISVSTKENSDIIFPIFTQGRIYQYNATLPVSTIPLIQLSGAMFITKSTLSAKLFAEEVVWAIIDIWPLFGVSILLAFASGVVMWIVDTWWNKEHFPRRFVSGAFEGFWWAFISMTTVGYGDRVPKSIPGRLFAVFWIFTGMTICALLTAALTTAIGAVAYRQRPSINHGKIGILKDRIFEKSILMRGNAHKVYKENLNDLVRSIHDRKIDGILLDSFTAKTFKSDILVTEELYVDSIVQDTDQSYLGTTIFDTDLHNLIQDYIEYHKDYIKDFVYENFQSLEEITDTKIMANLIFTTQSGMFLPVVYTCSVVLGVTLLIGLTYELYQHKKTTSIKKQQSTFRVSLKSLKREEQSFEADLEALLEKWNKDLLKKMKAYTLQGIFTRTNTTFPNVVVKLSPMKKEKDYCAESFEVLEIDMETSVPKKIRKSKKKSQIHPINSNNDDTEEHFSHGKYMKLKEIKSQKDSPIVSSKVKKNSFKKKSKKKISPKVDLRKEDIISETEEEEVKKVPKKKKKKSETGDIANGNINGTVLERKLPPLRTNNLHVIEEGRSTFA